MLITKDQKNLEKIYPTKIAIPHLFQILKNNLKTNERIHTRLIISDEKIVLLMTADLEQNSM